MEVQNNAPLLVLNLENCPDDDDNPGKGSYFYTLSMAANGQENTIIEIPVTLECSKNDIPVIMQYNDNNTCPNEEDKTPSSSFQHQQADVVQDDLSHRDEENNSIDFYKRYYTELKNYLAYRRYPAGVSQSYERLLIKRAQNYKLIEGKLFYGHNPPKEVITEKEKQQQLLKNFHIEETTGIHLGSSKMFAAISSFYFWKGLYMDINTYVRNCNGCVDERNYLLSDHTCKSGLPPSTLEEANKDILQNNILQESSDSTWKQIELQLLGRYPKTNNNNQFLIVIIDPVSYWMCAQPVTDTDIPLQIAKFVFKIFCTFGFTKCCFLNILQEVFEDSVQKFITLLDNINDVFKPMAKSVKLSNSRDLLSYKKSIEHAPWVNAMFHELVDEFPDTWDEKIDMCLFRFHTTSRLWKKSPFSSMFHHGPIIWDPDNKENISTDNRQILRRRTLRNTFLNCRHCRDTFTSRISFLIHQRKHTEEAKSNGLMEGEEDIGETIKKELRIMKRTSKLTARNNRKKQLGRALMKSRIQPFCTSSSKSLLDVQHDKIQAGAVAAAQEMIRASISKRKFRGKYHKYSQELQEEIAKYALSHGKLETARYFSKKLGSTVNESSVRNIVKLHCFFTPDIKKEIGEYASLHGMNEASRYFTERLGRSIRRGLVCKFMKFYQSQCSKSTHIVINKPHNSSTIKKSCKKNVYDSNLKQQIGLYACNASIPDTIKHFRETQQLFLKDSVVRKFRKIYASKSQTLEKNPVKNNQLQNVVYNASSNPKADILTALNLQNISHNDPYHREIQQIITTESVSLPHPIQQLPFSSAEQANSSAFLNISLPKYSQPVQNASSVIVNQNTAPVTLQHSHLYPPVNSVTPGLQGTFISLLNNNLSQPFTNSSSHVENIVSSQASASTEPLTAVSAIKYAVTPLQHDQPIFQTPHNSTITSQNHNEIGISHINNLPLLSQTPLIVPQQQENPTVTQHFLSQSLRPFPSQDFQQLIQGGREQVHTDSNQIIPVLHNQPLLIHPISSLPQCVDSSFTLNTNMCLPTSVENTVPVVDSNCSCNVSPEKKSPQKNISDSCSLQQKQDMSNIIIHVLPLGLTETDNRDNTQLSSESLQYVDQQQQQYKKQQKELRQKQEQAQSIHSKLQKQSLEEKRQFSLNKEPSQEVQQKSNVIHYAKVNDNLLEDEDVDDPDPIDNTCMLESSVSVTVPYSPKDETKGKATHTARSTQGKRKQKKKNKKTSQKRGNYATYSPELRAEMGRYAAEFGSLKACNHFRKIVGHDIPESTIRGLRDKYLVKLSHNDNESGTEKVTKLGYAPRGRPMRLGKYDDVVRQCVVNLAKTGENISSFLVIAMARQVLLQYEPELLEENGGNIKLNNTWAKSFLRRIGMQNSA